MPYKDPEKRKEYNKEYSRKYYQTNIDKKEKYRKERVEKTREYDRNRYLQNKQEVIKRVVLNKKERRKLDISFKFIENLRSRQGKVMKGMMSTTKGLGCNSTFLRSYIENLWEPWMNWDNYGNKEGQWSIDHIIALSSFEMDGEGNWDPNSKYNKKLIHYTNLRPLLHKENMEKSNKVLDIY